MENLEAILNTEQAEAVRYTEGPLLVLAGAGSGKTRVLTHRIAYLIENCGVHPWNILAITFTNKAAGEMRERLDGLIGSAAQEVWASTFHSLCVRILRRNIAEIGYSGDFSIYDTDDQRTVMRQIFKDLNIDSRMIKERGVLSEISAAKNEGIRPEEYRDSISFDLRKKTVADCYFEYEKRLRGNNALDFDDLLLKTVELLKEHEQIRLYYQERFRYILVDEYQDTNSIQLELVRLLAEKYKNICVVGDDDQSIYRFRGAKLENILTFEKLYPGARVVKLEQNYRSTEKILNIANAVISHNNARKEKRLWTEKKGGEEPRFREYENANEEAAAVIREVRDSGRAYRDQAVLYRTNAQSRLLEEQCIKLNVPYQIVGGMNFYQRKEIKDVLAYMKVIANASDELAFERIINIPKRGIGEASLAKLRAYAQAGAGEEHGRTLLEAALNCQRAGIGGKAARALQDFAEMVAAWKESLDDAGLLQGEAKPGMENSFSLRALIESIRDDTGYGEELLKEGEVEAASRFENISEIISKAADYQAGSEAPKLAEFLEEVSLVSDLDRKDENADSLTLMTLHGAKGLEFPKVYLVGLSDGLFPGFHSIGEQEELEEERRLCYVGITRAREELVMSSARSRMVNGEYLRLLPSCFVGEMPDSMVEKEFLYAGRPEERSGDFGGEDSALPWSSTGQRRGFGAGAYGSAGAHDGMSYGAAAYGREQSGTALSRFSKTRRGGGIPAFLQTGKELLKSERPEYEAGDRVSHVKFGEGTVAALEEEKKDYMVTVDFDKMGRKKMYAGFAKLKKL